MAEECVKATTLHVKQWLGFDITKQAKIAERKMISADDWYDTKKAKKYFENMSENDKLVLYLMASELWFHGYCRGRELLREELRAESIDNPKKS
jgi:hypothetical protein